MSTIFIGIAGGTDIRCSDYAEFGTPEIFNTDQGCQFTSAEFTQPLQDFVNEHAWGSVWSREGLPLKTRSLITLAALTALKCPQELKGHVRGALNNGCTVEEIREALLHCAVYAGVPAAIDAFRAAQEVIDTYQKEG